MTPKEMRKTRICGKQDFKCEAERNNHTLHYKQAFGNVFERRENKCCAVLMMYCCIVKGDQVITLQMAQQLKIKILMLY